MSKNDQEFKLSMMEDKWFADESFWRDAYQVMFHEDAFRKAPEHVDRLIELTGVRSGTVLDLCCGPGRHSVAFALKGFTVTGVDLSAFLIDVAKEHAASNGVSPEFVIADMRSFVRPNTFDLICNLFTSFGYFDDREDDRRVVTNIYNSLNAAGVLVLDLIGKEIVARGWGDRTMNLPGGTTCVQRIKIVEDWSRMKSEWIFTRPGFEKSYRFSQRLYSGQELHDLLAWANFKVSLFGDFDGRPYGPESTRLIAVGAKT